MRRWNNRTGNFLICLILIFVWCISGSLFLKSKLVNHFGPQLTIDENTPHRRLCTSNYDLTMLDWCLRLEFFYIWTPRGEREVVRAWYLDHVVVLWPSSMMRLWLIGNKGGPIYSTKKKDLFSPSYIGEPI